MNELIHDRFLERLNGRLFGKESVIDPSLEFPKLERQRFMNEELGILRYYFFDKYFKIFEIVEIFEISNRHLAFLKIWIVFSFSLRFFEFRVV